MKQKVVNGCLNNITKYNNLSESKLAIIKYGLEALYTTVTKIIVICLISYLLGTIKELLMFMAFYGLLRLTGFGLHAKENWQCWIISLLSFTFVPYLIQMIIFPLYVYVLICSLCSLLILKYAPADTEKRPLIREKKRRMYKILCFATAIVYIALTIILNITLYSNLIVISLLFEVIMILPVSYKLLNLKYNNYLSFNANYS